MFDEMRARIRAAFGGRQPGGRMFTIAQPTEAGVAVSEDSAMRFATVHACVRVLSEDVAALPLHVYRRMDGGGKERAREHPLYELLHDRPNPEMSATPFFESLMVNALLSGNGYAFLEFDRAGRVRAMWPMLASEVDPYRTDAGELRYRAGGENLRAGEVFHLAGMGFDGLMGLSPIAYARESIGLGTAAERYGEKFFRNGTHIGGVVSIKDELTDDQFRRLREQFNTMFKGLQNAHGVPVLEGGATYTPVGIAPEDAQFLETRKFQRNEIAAIYRVPPHMIGDLERATFSNIEQQDLAYLQRGLLPWLMRIEQEARAKLLTTPEARRDYCIEHDTANFMRGETQSRYEAYSKAITSGFMTQNEVRRRENLNPLPGGDEIMLPLNMVKAGETTAAGDARGGEADRNARSAPNEREARVWKRFIPGGERRAAGNGNIAAQLQWLGVQKKMYDRIARAFSKWLERQANDIAQIVAEETGSGKRSRKHYRDYEDSEATQRRIMGRLASYYKRLANEDEEYGLEKAIEKGEYPEWKDVNEALAEIAGDAWKRVGQELGTDAVPDAEWQEGYLKKYRSKMTTRLCKANYADLERAMKRAGADEDIAEQIASTLMQWRKGEYSTSRRGESMAKTEIAMMRNEALIAAYRQAGYSSVWRSAPGCCRICTGMNGQTVTTLKPPLHKGCGCDVMRGLSFKDLDKGLKNEDQIAIMDVKKDKPAKRPTQKIVEIIDGNGKVQSFNVDIKYGHHSAPSRYKPMGVIDVVSDDGRVSRYIYDKDGKMKGHIDNHDHGNPARHPFKNGEHFNMAIWKGEDLAGFKPGEDLTAYQRKVNADILKGDE